VDGIFEFISIHIGRSNSYVHSNNIIFTAHNCVSHVNKQFSVIMECGSLGVPSPLCILQLTRQIHIE